MSIAKGASPVTENEFKLFQRAMGEQGQTKSSVQDVIANASKKGQLDAWYVHVWLYMYACDEIERVLAQISPYVS